jgi:hypothetical protein
LGKNHLPKPDLSKSITSAKDPLAAEEEAQLQEAIAAVLRNEHICHGTATAFNVPCRLCKMLVRNSPLE